MDEFGTKITDEEWACMEVIARSELASCGKAHSAEDGVAPCSHEVVQRLRSAGLVEVVAVVWLPLEMKRSVLRLTAEGKLRLGSRRKQ